MAYSDIDSNKVLNKEGLLELCSQIKTEIANNSGSGGSTYTAGKNITIDANNTINAQPEISAWILQSLLYAGTPFENEVVELNSSNSTTDFINALQAGKLIYISSSVSWSGLGTTLANLGYTKYIKIPQITLNSFGYTTYNLTLTNQQNWKPEQTYYYQAYENTIFGAPGGGLAKWLRYYSTNSGLSAGTIWGAIDELAGNVATKLTAPTAPTTDGQYKLTSTITSGSPAYSWEADSGSSGASYTAGDGIDIDANGVISKSLPASTLFGLLYCIEANNTNVYNSNAWITGFLGSSPNNWALTNATGREKHIKNLKTFGMTYLPQGFSGDNNGQYLKQIISAVGGDDITTSLPIVGASNNVNTQYTVGMGLQSFGYGYMDMLGYQNKPVLILFNGTESKGSNYRWYFISNPEKVFQNKYFNSASGLTSHSIPQAIDEVATNLNTRVPAAPTTDGDYVLKVSVSSGTPTYSWVSAS